MSRLKRRRRLASGAPLPKHGSPLSAIKATVARMGSATVRAYITLGSTGHMPSVQEHSFQEHAIRCDRLMPSIPSVFETNMAPSNPPTHAVSQWADASPASIMLTEALRFAL